MKIGCNTVLFGGHSLEIAFEKLAQAGYDGVELSAIDGMSEHLVLDRWKDIAPKIKELSKTTGLALLAMEQPSQDEKKMEAAFQAAAELRIPVINCGPGGKTGDEESFQKSVETLGKLVQSAEKHGVILCVKAHVGQAVHNTPMSLRLLQAIPSKYFGLDMDPSHLWRAGENPVESVAPVASRIRHIHIRDCKGRQQGPGTPELQANGRGDIDLIGYVRELHKAGFEGALDLEVIGAKDYSADRCLAIASEARGHMMASLQACGAR